MLAASLLLLLSPAIEAAVLLPDERLIILGQDGPSLDGCAAYGEVTGLNPKGDGFLSVRVGPSTKAREKDRVRNGQALALCDTQGDWIGIVYSKSGDADQDCGSGTPSAYLGAYRGPCRYGWVHKRFVELLAG